MRSRPLLQVGKKYRFERMWNKEQPEYWTEFVGTFKQYGLRNSDTLIFIDENGFTRLYHYGGITEPKVIP